ncbi:MAG: hypothetical protein U0183_13880 [Polyangiaceae bacterium]
MGEYLEARGRRVDVVFGLLRPGALALVAVDLFMEAVALPADDVGVVRCRLAGRPAALVDVDGGHFLDVAGLARVWPKLVAELFERAGDGAARALLASPTIVRPLEALKEILVESEIHADALYDLGRGPLGPRLASVARAEVPPSLEVSAARAREGAFSFEFPRGRLTLTYTHDAFVRGASSTVSALEQLDAIDVEVTWNERTVVLPRAEETPWHDDEVAELAVLGAMAISEHPEKVVDLFGAVLPEVGHGIAPSLALGSVLNLWGVALRKTGALEAAVRTLEAAHTIATRDASALEPSGQPLDADTRRGLEQQVVYNLGYTKLQTTMKARTSVGPDGANEVVLADYDVREEHRAVWTACATLFERALALAPEDATAASQVRQVKVLLAALDGGALPATAPETPPPERATKGKSRPAPAPPREDERFSAMFKPMGIAALVIVLVVAASLREARQPPPPPPPSPKVDAGPSARELSETARRAAVLRLDAKVGLDAGTTPCTIAVASPQPVPRGTVTAPRIGRAIGTTGELLGTEHFDATVRQYAALYAPALDVLPATPSGVGPVKGGERPRSWGSPYPYAVTLVVTGWTDPVVTGANATLSIVPGRLEGRLFVWSYASSRFVCAGDVTTSNTTPLVVVRGRDLKDPEDDPLNRARLDLVAEAYRKGISGLRELE